MTVKAWLEGHEYDLDDLIELLSSGNTRVVKDNDGYYLTSTEIDDRPTGVPFYEVAAQVLRRVNGLARAKNPQYRPVRLAGRYHDGDRPHTVVPIGTVEARARIYAAAVVISDEATRVPQLPANGPQFVSLATAHPDVAEALALMGQPEPLGWVEMWKVYEVVRDNIKPSDIVALGWFTRAEVSGFGAGANRPDVSGTSARHARMGGRHRPTGWQRKRVGPLSANW